MSLPNAQDSFEKHHCSSQFPVLWCLAVTRRRNLAGFAPIYLHLAGTQHRRVLIFSCRTVSSSGWNAAAGEMAEFDGGAFQFGTKMRMGDLDQSFCALANGFPMQIRDSEFGHNVVHIPS